MGQVRHGSATTTHAFRAAIQRSQASLSTLKINRRDQRVSTIDLFTERLTLVSPNARWIDAARSVSQATGVAIDAVHVGSDIRFPAERSFEVTFGVSAEGACLVRPDAVVAWRAPGMDTGPEWKLSRALAQMTGRDA